MFIFPVESALLVGLGVHALMPPPSPPPFPPAPLPPPRRRPSFSPYGTPNDTKRKSENPSILPYSILPQVHSFSLEACAGRRYRGRFDLRGAGVLGRLRRPPPRQAMAADPEREGREQDRRLQGRRR